MMLVSESHHSPRLSYLSGIGRHPIPGQQIPSVSLFTGESHQSGAAMIPSAEAVGAAAAACGWIIASAGISFRIRGSALPITGQTLAVCLSSRLLGRSASCLGAASYVALARVGLPVLAGWKSGAPVRSMGYIVGFVPCAAISAIGDSADPLQAFWWSASGQLSCLLMGGIWSIACLPPACLLEVDTWARTWSTATKPLLPGLFIKAVLVAAVASVCQHAGLQQAAVCATMLTLGLVACSRAGGSPRIDD